MFPPSLSPSRAGDFMTCPLLYRLRVIDKIPEPPAAAAVRGTLVHGALEDLFALDAADRTVDRAVALFEERWRSLQDSDPVSAAVLVSGLAEDATSVAQAVIAPARSLLDTYFTMEDPSRLEPHAREMAVSTDLPDGLTLRGYVDRVDRAPDGRIRLVDYKTGKSPGAGFESKAMFQMRFYALVWWRMTGDVPTRLQLLYLKDGQSIAYEPEAEELLATERKILAIRDAIARAVDDGFSPSPSALCAWCSFHDLCPSQGGVAPPLPALG
jgi:putative RecB family exonuclease